MSAVKSVADPQAPLVSVVMPVYNAQATMARSIDSVLAQTHRELELILVDDGSRDGSAAIMEAYAARDARVRYLGERPHAWVRQAIKRAHLLVVPSRMEGGANVVVEAVTSGTPVVGSRMSGNVGMLGDDYPGLFDVGDADGLAALLVRAHADRAFLASLGARCRAVAPRFTPDAERVALAALLDEALHEGAGRMDASPLCPAIS